MYCKEWERHDLIYALKGTLETVKTGCGEAKSRRKSKSRKTKLEGLVRVMKEAEMDSYRDVEWKWQLILAKTLAKYIWSNQYPWMQGKKEAWFLNESHEEVTV